MAEKDPCELFPEEEIVEEEVDPEYQETGGSFADRWRNPLGPSASDLNEGMLETDTSALRDESNPEVQPLTDEMRSQVAAGAATRVANQLQGDLGEGLENDVSFTPVYQGPISAGRSTWIINNSSLLDFGLTTNDRGEAKFLSKPKQLLAQSIGNGRNNGLRAPVSVNNSNYEIDPIRWASDRLWINIEHAEGPAEYVNQLVAKTNHGRNDSSPDLYFVNKTTAEDGWGLLYEDQHKRMFITYIGDVGSTPDWANINDLKQDLNSKNSLGIDIRYETHRLQAEKFLNSPERWNWANYFFGHISRENVNQITGQDSIQRLREDANNQTESAGWRGVYIRHGSSTTKASLNPFPFVPYYGENLSLNQDTNPIYSALPPTVGRKIYTDYTTNVTDLLSKEESDVLQVGNKSYFDIRPVYSYYDCLYEKVFSGVLSEMELPSPYIRQPDFGFETSSRRAQGLSVPRMEDFEEQQFQRLTAADGFFLLNFFSDYNPNQATDIQAQETFAEAVRGASNRNPEAERDLAIYMSEYYGFNIGNQDSNIYLSRFDTETLDEIYERRYLNPMFVEMEFGSIEKSQLAEAMTLNGDNTLVKSLFGSLLPNTDTVEVIPGVAPGQESTRVIESPPVASYVDQLLQSGLNSLDNLDTKIGFSDTIPIENERTLDFSEWFDKTFEFFTAGVGMTPAEKFANIFRMLLIKGKIARFVNARARTYAQILSGVPAKSEVLGFIIDKYEIDRRNEATYISSFHLLSNNDREVERFVDSQVKYGKIYEYRINRVVAVVGNKYAYARPGNVDLGDIDAARIAEDLQALRSQTAIYRQGVGVVNMPFLQIMSIPSTTKRVAVADRPPLYPNIDVIPFKNDQNRVLFNLSANCGEYLAPPVLLEDDDNLQFYTVAVTQGLQSVQNVSYQDVTSLNFSLARDLSDAEMIRFRSDDPASTFEVFRIDRYPRTIQDFRGNKLRKDFTNSDNFSFVDNIRPDKKYYYIFRTEDVHGHVSNPSHIYEVELITFNESVRLSVKIVEPEDIANKKKMLRQSTRQARQFVSIKPNISQKTLQLPESGEFQDLVNASADAVFGEPEVSKLWGKKFKLRIRSKNTGKEVDVNFRFNVKVQKNEENKKVNLIC
jgi:hypothetical protein